MEQERERSLSSSAKSTTTESIPRRQTKDRHEAARLSRTRTVSNQVPVEIVCIKQSKSKKSSSGKDSTVPTLPFSTRREKRRTSFASTDRDASLKAQAFLEKSVEEVGSEENCDAGQSSGTNITPMISLQDLAGLILDLRLPVPAAKSA